jgi:exopolyphosphatase/guanosine-5'-triphosphate,3'-diphosphate pyrophosphatase
MEKQIVIIDCGTNTFNLLLAKVNKVTQEVTFLHEEKRPVKIGKGLTEKSEFTPEAMQRALEALSAYAELVREWNPDQVRVLATAGFRLSNNASVFIEQVYQETGFRIEVISGEQEAYLIYQGARHAYAMNERPHLIMDIGGGSTEFIHCSAEGLHQCWSFEAGASRLLEVLSPSDPMNAADIERIRNYLTKILKPLTESLPHFIPVLIGTSGFFDTLKDMAVAGNYLPEVPGALYREISPELFNHLYRLMLPLNVQQRAVFPGMISFRAEMIMMGFELTRYIIEQFNVQQIITTPYSMKEGALFSSL